MRTFHVRIDLNLLQILLLIVCFQLRSSRAFSSNCCTMYRFYVRIPNIFLKLFQFQYDPSVFTVTSFSQVLLGTIIYLSISDMQDQSILCYSFDSWVCLGNCTYILQQRSHLPSNAIALKWELFLSCQFYFISNAIWGYQLETVSVIEVPFLFLMHISPTNSWYMNR